MNVSLPNAIRSNLTFHCLHNVLNSLQSSLSVFTLFLFMHLPRHFLTSIWWALLLTKKQLKVRSMSSPVGLSVCLYCRLVTFVRFTHYSGDWNFPQYLCGIIWYLDHALTTGQNFTEISSQRWHGLYLVNDVVFTNVSLPNAIVRNRLQVAKCRTRDAI